MLEARNFVRVVPSASHCHHLSSARTGTSRPDEIMTIFKDLYEIVTLVIGSTSSSAFHLTLLSLN